MESKRRFDLIKLAEILNGEIINPDKSLIEGVMADSRIKNKDSIFVAYKGLETDSHNFIEEAFKNGSTATVVTDRSKLGNRPGIVVKNGYKALSNLSALFAE